MRLLICAQAADSLDPQLSFFIGWIRELSLHFETVHVICLKEGEHELPSNVHVHSLGKEAAQGTRTGKRVHYIARLWSHIWRLRRDFDTVFVHQNQEYLLSAGLLFVFLQRPVYMWRNHYKGSFLTDVAASFCRKVFYTSQYSFTAKYKNARQMPVGVDTEKCKPVAGATRIPDSILFLSRMAPSKRPEVLLSALEALVGNGVSFKATFMGDPLPEDSAYYASLKKRIAGKALEGKVSFSPGVANSETPEVYSSHALFVNASMSGMYDKTILEGAACGCIVLASSLDFAKVADPRCVFKEGNTADLADKLEALLKLPQGERALLTEKLRKIALENDLRTLMNKVAKEIK